MALDVAGTTSGAAELSSAAPTLTSSGVSVVNVRKSFGVTRALDGCSLSAELGEIHAIVGGNGCGKSTLAKVMSGVLPIDSGQVSVLGHMPKTPNEAKELGLATVFQEILVADGCSVVDNLYVGADGLFSRALSYDVKLQRARSLMEELVGEPLDPEKLVGDLPLSIKQWIVIGRALLTGPKVLILDESSAALDFDSTERLFAKMRELRDRGSAVLIVTHRIAELIRISDRATVLRDGRDVGVLENREITERNLLSLMTGKSAEPMAERHEVTVAEERGTVMRARAMSVLPGAERMDFDLRRGEVLGIAGLDGQGQSEFTQILAGLRRAAEGAPEMIGRDGTARPIRDLAEAEHQRVVYVSGDRKREGIFPNLSIFENLLLPLYRGNSRVGQLGLIDWQSLSGIFEWEREKLAILMGDRGDKITSLSGGNQQKVMIGRAFALNPSILVLNDPARGIDVGAKAELYKQLTSFAASGCPVIYMSSEIEEFVGFAHRVVVFRHGSVFDEFAGANIDPDRILAAMFGQTAGIRTETRATPAQGGPQAMKIVEFDDERELDVQRGKQGRIKIREFDTEVERRPRDTSPRQTAAPELPKPQAMKIVDFDSEEQSRTMRASVGPMKIVEFDKEEERDRELERDRSRRGLHNIKIIEFD